ncbi:hypothetical protein BDZ97DRAFT_1850141 [Flammula alnicola]|nr:hypothetical protein BDZ97DRAFT_1850141 [Flammula alnicola]
MFLSYPAFFSLSSPPISPSCCTMRCRYNRTASALITLFGAATNAILTVQILAAWRSVKWEPESEWESSGDKWQLTGVQVIWGLLSIYFASAAAVCAVGLYGVLKVRPILFLLFRAYVLHSCLVHFLTPQHKPSHVRFYRDYSIADFSFCAIFTALATYGAFLSPARAGVCEEFSHHPELMRDMLEVGLNIENCELWLERAVFAGLAFLVVIMAIRLHFLLAVSSYYSHLVRHRSHHQRSASCSASLSAACMSTSSLSTSSGSGSAAASTHSLLLSTTTSHSMQRILVLPSNSKPSGPNGDLESGVEMVYAPVPRHTLPRELQEQAAEAWMSTPSGPSNTTSSSSSTSTTTSPSPHHHRRHHHHHSHSHSHHRHRSASRETTGRIKLDIGPGEGLLPLYADVVAQEVEADVKE